MRYKIWRSELDEDSGILFEWEGDFKTCLKRFISRTDLYPLVNQSIRVKIFVRDLVENRLYQVDYSSLHLGYDKEQRHLGYDEYIKVKPLSKEEGLM